MRRLLAIIALCVMPVGAIAQDAAQDNGAQDAAQDSAAPADAAMAQRTAQALETCFDCHGPGGVSVIPTRPTIAGQKAAYVARQLRAFRKAAATDHAQSDGDGDDLPQATQGITLPGRSDPVMEHMAQGLDDALIDSISRAVSQLPCDGEKPGVLTPKPLPPPTIANRCVACHGANGIGTQPHVPNLAGQRRAYLRRQLLLIRETAFGAAPREGERWRDHPIMERQAGRLSITDVDALADYYASLNCRG